MNVYDITKSYEEGEYKSFLSVLESIIRSQSSGHFKVGENGNVAKITIEVINE